MQSCILEIYPPFCTHTRVSLVAQLVKNPPAIQETWVRSLSWEDPLEKGKATHSSILAWRIPWTRVHGVAKSQTQLINFHSLHTHLARRPHWSIGWKAGTPCRAEHVFSQLSVQTSTSSTPMCQLRRVECCLYRKRCHGSLLDGTREGKHSCVLPSIYQTHLQW